MLDDLFDDRRTQVRVECHSNSLTIHVDSTGCALLLLFRHGEGCEQMPRAREGLCDLGAPVHSSDVQLNNYYTIPDDLQRVLTITPWM